SQHFAKSMSQCLSGGGSSGVVPQGKRVNSTGVKHCLVSDTLETPSSKRKRRWESIHDYIRLDPRVMEGVDFARSDDLSSLFAFSQFSKTMDLSSHSGDLAQLQGYVAEGMVAAELQAKGHDVEFPEASNQAGWDKEGTASGIGAIHEQGRAALKRRDPARDGEYRSIRRPSITLPEGNEPAVRVSSGMEPKNQVIVSKKSAPLLLTNRSRGRFFTCTLVSYAHQTS